MIFLNSHRSVKHLARIEKLDTMNAVVSSQIEELFRMELKQREKNASYHGAPYQNGSILNYSQVRSEYFGIWNEQELVALVETIDREEATFIPRIIVNPKCFRSGLAGKLLAFVYNLFDSKRITVEVCSANSAAVSFYQKFGFSQVQIRTAENGIKRILFQKLRF